VGGGGGVWGGGWWVLSGRGGGAGGAGVCTWVVCVKGTGVCGTITDAGSGRALLHLGTFGSLGGGGRGGAAVGGMCVQAKSPTDPPPVTSMADSRAHPSQPRRQCSDITPSPSHTPHPTPYTHPIPHPPPPNPQPLPPPPPLPHTPTPTHPPPLPHPPPHSPPTWKPRTRAAVLKSSATRLNRMTLMRA
jgi:hypothetical protein